MSYKLKAIAQRLPLSEAVQDAIKEYIVTNGLKPGDLLPSESELALRLGVGRNSVREGVKSLAVLGILESRQGSGLFVSEFSFDPILKVLPYGMHFHVKQHSDLLEVRYHLEYGMADRVLQAVTDSQIRGLDAILESFGREASMGRYSAADDRAFHSRLYENVDNAVLQKIIDLFWDLLRLALDRSELVPSPDPVETFRRHVPILTSIKRRDPDAYRKAMTAHYLGMERRLAASHDKGASRTATMGELSLQAVLRPNRLAVSRTTSTRQPRKDAANRKKRQPVE